MSEELTERHFTKVFRPHSTLPEGDYNFEDYLAVMVDNLRGPLRQFRSRMLDLGNLMYVDPEQRRVFRDFVFRAERDMTAIFNEWCEFYGLDTENVKEAINDEHTERSGSDV